MRKRIALALIAPLAVLALTACGDDSDEPDQEESSETTEATEESEPTEETSPTEADDEESDDAEEEAPAASGELTEPGSDLAIGDRATVAAEYAGNPVTVELAVTSIDEGTQDDIADIGLEDVDPQDYTPYYVKIDATLVDGDGSSYDPSVDVDAFAGETPAASLITFSEFKPCNGEAFESDAQAGDTLQTCAAVLAEKGDVVDSAVFAGGDDYSIYDDKQITWE